MWRKDLPFVLGLCALVLFGLTAIVGLFSLARPGTNPPTVAAATSQPGVPKLALAPRTVSRAMMGMNESQVVQQLGAPLVSLPGAQEHPDPGFAQVHPKAKTLVFRNTGGFLYVIFDQTPEGQWVCISSQLVPEEVSIEIPVDAQ